MTKNVFLKLKFADVFPASVKFDKYAPTPDGVVYKHIGPALLFLKLQDS